MLKQLFLLLKEHPAPAAFSVLLLLDAAWLIAGLSTKSSALFHGKELCGVGVAHVVLWTVGPPAWFFLETYTLGAHLLPDASHPDDPARKAGYERMRLGQDLASKVWAAVLAAILFLIPK